MSNLVSLQVFDNINKLNSMKTIYWSQIKKAKKDIYVNIIAKGGFTKGDIIEHPIKKIKREDDSLYIDIDGIPAGNDLTFFRIWDFTSLSTGKNYKAWVFVGTRQIFKDYQEGECIYFAKIPKGSSYIEIGNCCLICDKVIII